MKEFQDVFMSVAPRLSVSFAAVPCSADGPDALRATKGLRLQASLLVPCVFLILSACAEKPEVTPYDYDTREKAKIDLPRNTSMDIDTDEFVVKKKFRLPEWMR